MALDSRHLPLRILQENMDNNMNKNDDDTPEDYIDDVYHCDDPEVIEDEFDKDKTVICDWDTYEWDLDALDEDRMPKHCRDWRWEFDGIVEDLKDWEEPCYLWSIIYGDLKLPSGAREYY